MRLIDADDFLAWLDVGHLRNPGEVCFCEADVADMIKSRPTIDAVPVRPGKWKLIGADKKGRGGIWKCAGRDGCGKTYPYQCDYCPNCGARMEVQDDD